MKVLKVLHGNLVIKSVLLGIVVLCIGIPGYFYVTGTSYFVKLFFPEVTGNSLIYEIRKIPRSSTKREKLSLIIDELLLGAVAPNTKAVFPREAKLLSLWIQDSEVLLNFNKEFLNNLEWENPAGDTSATAHEREHAFYSLLLQSVVHTICAEERSIKIVKFYFDGKPYKYIGTLGPLDGGLKPDWKLLKK